MIIISEFASRLVFLSRLVIRLVRHNTTLVPFWLIAAYKSNVLEHVGRGTEYTQESTIVVQYDSSAVR